MLLLMNGILTQRVDILLVEDSAVDAALTAKAFDRAKVLCHLHLVQDGVEAIAFLRQQGKYAKSPRPQLILLDLNLPKKNGCEVLSEIKSDPVLRTIPTIVLTTSEDRLDILRAYQLHANCYLTKPENFKQFATLVERIEDFWLTFAKLPAS